MRHEVLASSISIAADRIWHSSLPLFVLVSVDSLQEEVMHIPTRSERQRSKALRILLEIEGEHLAI
jgi:hypothetical protein